MSAAIDISAELSKQDVGLVLREMHRGNAALGRSLGKGVQAAGWAIADSLRTATALSPKKRPVTEVKGQITKKGNKTFEVERWHKGAKRTFNVYAKGKREANALPQVKIKNRGLAAKAWLWSQVALGTGRGGTRVGPEAARIAKQQSHVSRDLKSSNPWVRIENSLEYASRAFKTDGPQAIDSVMQRASRKLEEYVKRQLAKTGAK